MKKLERILKIASSVILFCFLAVPCFATILTITYTAEAPNTTIRSTHWNQDMSDVQNFLNGNNLDSTDNIKAGGISTAALANLAVTNAKLNPIDGASKISGAAFYNLSSTPSGAGIVPAVNLASGSPGSGNVLVGSGIWGDVPAQAMPTGSVVQVAYQNFPQRTTGSTTFTTSATHIPTTSDGDQYMTLAFSPLIASDTLKIEVIWNGTNTSTDYQGVALYRDSTTNALTSTTQRNAVTDYIHPFPIIYETTATATALTTFKVRAGCNSGGTTTFNGDSSVGYIGQTFNSGIMITEYRS